MALNYTNPGWTNDDEPYIDADNLNDISDNLEEATELIGNETLDTTATTVTGAIKELVGRLGSTVIGTVGTTITSAIKAIQDKLAIVYYSAEAKRFSIYYDDTHRLNLNKGEGNDYELFLVDAGDSRIAANTTTGEGVFKVVQSSTGDQASVALNPSTGNASLYHGDGGEGGYRVLLNNNKGGRNAMFRVDVGDDTSMLLNKTLGTLDIRLDGTTRKNRLYICDGTGSDPQSMILRCGDSYVEKPADMNRLNLAAGDGAYLSIGSNTNEGVAGRAYMIAPGGFFINGARNGILSYSGSKTTSAGGNFSMTFSKRCVVFAAYCNLADTLVIPYPVSGTGTSGATEWWFHVQGTGGAAVTSRSITAVVFYMNLE